MYRIQFGTGSVPIIHYSVFGRTSSRIWSSFFFLHLYKLIFTLLSCSLSKMRSFNTKSVDSSIAKRTIGSIPFTFFTGKTFLYDCQVCTRKTQPQSGVVDPLRVVCEPVHPDLESSSRTRPPSLDTDQSHTHVGVLIYSRVGPFYMSFFSSYLPQILRHSLLLSCLWRTH